MFCNQCGTSLQPEYNLCPKCGQPVANAMAVRQVPDRLERHLHILGILWMIAGALFLVPSLVLMVVGGMAHMFIPGEEAVARLVGPLVLNIIGGVLLIVAAGGILIGWGLMNHQPWARIAGIILGVISIFHPPIGTALGIYTLWVLLSGDAGAQYDRMARTA